MLFMVYFFLLNTEKTFEDSKNIGNTQIFQIFQPAAHLEQQFVSDYLRSLLCAGQNIQQRPDRFFPI